MVEPLTLAKQGSNKKRFSGTHAVRRVVRERHERYIVPCNVIGRGEVGAQFMISRAHAVRPRPLYHFVLIRKVATGTCGSRPSAAKAPGAVVVG